MSVVLLANGWVVSVVMNFSYFSECGKLPTFYREYPEVLEPLDSPNLFSLDRPNYAGTCKQDVFKGFSPGGN